MKSTLPREPVAKIRTRKLVKHGDVRVDPYFWMKNRDSPEVLQHLAAENRYTDRVLGDTKDLQKRLFREMRSRIREKDRSVPYKDGEFYYFARTEVGAEYPAFYRSRKFSTDTHSRRGEELLIDGNRLARGHSFFSLRRPVPSPSGNRIAFAIDTVGRRFYTIHFKDLESGKTLKQTIANTTGNFVWGDDDDTLFYTRQDAKTLRSQWLYRLTLSTGKSELIFHEGDETYFLTVTKSLTDRYLFLYSNSTLSTEVRFLDLQSHSDAEEWHVFSPREKKLEYSVADGGDRFYILTNHRARNFRLMECPIGRTRKSSWKEVIAHRDDVLIEDLEVFETRIALQERHQGLTRIELISRPGGRRELIHFPDPAYVVGFGANSEYRQEFLRYEYESMNSPPGVFDYNFATRRTQRRKVREVPRYQAGHYRSERIVATSHDGTKIPVSLVYKKRARNPRAPLLLYAYGSYGMSMDPAFSSNRVSLLDRGFVFAIAHVRGGSEMGRHWYETGKLRKKKNTFLDFISCAENLADRGYCSREKIYAMGGSAGGLLMGAILNLRPDLFRGAIAAVPFVDVVTTMLDSSLPLTTFEYDEWGNPNNRSFYRYMKSYSPYDNVTRQAYPHLLVTTGYHDSQVQYWEPAKWVAKLRAYRANRENLLLLKTELKAGHGGKSGRFEALRELALEYAFLLKLEGGAKKS